MIWSRHIGLVLLVAITCTTQCGCLAIYSKKSIPVRVIDAETGQGIEDATIDVSYLPRGIDLVWALTLNRPDDEHRRTNHDGRVDVPVANTGWVSWSVDAEGYLGQSTMNFDGGRVPEEFIPGTEKLRDHSAVVRLYRGPLPQVTIVVPDGYRGPLLVDVRSVNRRVQGRPGQRNFVYHADHQGFVDIEATPLLLGNALQIRQFSWTSIRAQYASGAAIPKASNDDDEIALRWMTDAPPGQHVFVVGTKAEEDLLNSRIYRVIKGHPTHISDFDAIDKLFDDAARKSLVASGSARR
jgi:hypothetical protein